MTTDIAPHQSPVKPEHFYGWHPSLGDINNEPADTLGLTVLEERDPRDEMPDPYNQLQLGSCTGNAVAGAIEYDAILNGEHFGTPSRLFIYYGEREREGTVGWDAGAYGHDGFKVARKTGVPPEELWSYDGYKTKFKERPSDEAFAAAAEHKIGKYTHPGLGEVEDSARRHSLMAVLSNKQTVAFGFVVYESFESLELERTGIVPIPQSGEKVLGGHEVLIVGFLKDKPEYALVRNSWGTDWGMGGYCLFPWQFILNRQLCDDFRTIVRPAGA